MPMARSEGVVSIAYQEGIVFIHWPEAAESVILSQGIVSTVWPERKLSWLARCSVHSLARGYSVFGPARGFRVNSLAGEYRVIVWSTAAVSIGSSRLYS